MHEANAGREDRELLGKRSIRNGDPTSASGCGTTGSRTVPAAARAMSRFRRVFRIDNQATFVAAGTNARKSSVICQPNWRFACGFTTPSILCKQCELSFGAAIEMGSYR